MLIRDVVGLKYKQFQYNASDALVLPRCYTGVEVELEGLNRYNKKMDYWDITSDGSLRDNGLEFKFIEPLFGEDIILALKELQASVTPYNPRLSLRTSVHVHLDIRDLYCKDLFNLTVLYLIFERALVKYHEIREHNIFCLPYYLAEGHLLHLNSIICNFKIKEDLKLDLNRFNKDSSKYSALNFSCIKEFGSIEFRHMPGSYSPTNILEWINIIHSLKKATKHYEDPEALVNNVFKLGGFELARNVFSGELLNRLMYTSFEDDCYKGALLAQDLLYKQNLEHSNIYYKIPKGSK